ncbi:MAG: radical SAM protein [Deltaproteobacteria bacterium]|nr:radical SAM protein [Deltaproteobacteria bacterium]
METRLLNFPVSVTFISTYICNLTCEHCDICRLREDELSANEAKAMLKELSKLGVRSMSFEGGEPLTRPDIGELISFARGCGIDSSLVTNGTLVKRSLHKLGGLSRLFVRLFWDDGFIDGGPVYASALEAIEAADKAGLDVASVAALTKANIRALPAILSDCASLGVRVSFSKSVRHCHSNDNSRIGSMLPDEAELEEALRLLNERKAAGESITVPDSRAGNAAFESFSGVCSFVITPSGCVCPCLNLLVSRRWPSGLEKGFGPAFDEARKSHCVAEFSDPSCLKACNS